MPSHATRYTSDVPSLYFLQEDGNDPAHYEPETPIWAQAIDAFGAILSGPKYLLLENNRSSWEGGLVEAPWIINIGQYYYLFYSANVYGARPCALEVYLCPAARRTSSDARSEARSSFADFA